MNNPEIAAQFMVQLCVILLACLAMGRLARLIGQPPVVGEMIAGVMLGPSLLGALLPDIQDALFPKDGPTMSIIYTISQIGLVLYMFVIGLEFDTGLVAKHAKTAMSVSAAGLLVPLALGAVVAFALLADEGHFFSTGVSPFLAALFTGAAIATTAFPMLARIISEKGIAGTRVGTIALASGASTDAVSWVLLALVVAVFHSDPRVALLAVIGGAVYAVFLLTGGRRLLARALGDRAGQTRAIGSSTLITVLGLVLLAGAYTNSVGIHSIFGGFLLGVAMPRGSVTDYVRSHLEPVVKSLLLPLFFVFSGLNTQLGLLDSPVLWLVTLGVLAASVLGKGVACHVAARRSGLPKYESMAIGSLMNARGLIELILLNIGLQAGLITPTLFAVFVLMAVVTTLMAAPGYEWAARRGGIRAPHQPTEAKAPAARTAAEPALEGV